MSFQFKVVPTGCEVGVHRPIDDGHEVSSRVLSLGNDKSVITLAVVEWVHSKSDMPSTYYPCIKNESILYLSPGEAIKIRDMLNDSIARVPIE